MTLWRFLLALRAAHRLGQIKQARCLRRAVAWAWLISVAQGDPSHILQLLPVREGRPR